MTHSAKPTRRQQWLFWLILTAFSTFFAEVFSGSDMFPYFHPWGVLVVVPLYGLHILLLSHLVHRTGSPRFSSLVFAGIIFGLYEAYLTKILWAPTWGEALIVGGVAPIETLVLVLWWHTWFSFIIPLLVVERYTTSGRSVGQSLPGRVGSFLNSRWGLALIMVFGGIFQSVNSPSVGKSLLSGLSTTVVLTGLIILWRHSTHGMNLVMADLMPDKRQFRILLFPTALLYLVMGFTLRPDAIPGLVGQLVIWLLYAAAIILLIHSLKPGPGLPDESPAAPSGKLKPLPWMLLAGIFPLSATISEVLLEPIAHPMALVFWFAGILFGVFMFVTAVRQSLSQKGKPHHE